MASRKVCLAGLLKDWPSVTPLNVIEAGLSNSTDLVFGCGNDHHVLAAANCSLLQILVFSQAAQKGKTYVGPKLANTLGADSHRRSLTCSAPSLYI